MSGRTALLVGAAMLGLGCGGATTPAALGGPSLPAHPAVESGELEVLGLADYGWSLRTVEGEVVSLEAYRGRPVFLNVWATWCPPCVAELGSIGALMDSLEGSEVAFLLVSPEEAPTVERFAARLERDLPVAVEHTRLPDAWGVEALPTTVVVDREGRIVLRHRGAADWDDPAVRAFLLRLAEGT